MTRIALIRHGPTDWNADRRLQGRADRPLSEAGRLAVGSWRLPPEFQGYRWYASPLARATETAALLGIAYEIEAAIVEMDWGEWEGHTHAELLEKYGDEMLRRTAQGLDLRPHGGESPREVRDRFAAWARRIAAEGRATGAVVHQGIIRAALSLATGWEMIGKPPVRMDWASVHVFDAGPEGSLAIAAMNISLEADRV